MVGWFQVLPAVSLPFGFPAGSLRVGHTVQEAFSEEETSIRWLLRWVT